MRDDDHKSQFTDWLQKHSASVLKVARAYTLTSDDCQDLAQEILLQAWRSMRHFRGEASLATWFYRVALHTAMHWRRKDRPRRKYQRALLEVHATTGDSLDSSGQMEQREIVEQLYQAIRQLPETAVPLVLLYLDGLSYREIANVLGISESNVGVKLGRAKKALAALMNETEKGDGHGS